MAEDTTAGPGTGFTEARFTHSGSLPGVLTVANCSLLVSTYQAGQLVGIGVHDDAVQFSFHRVDQAMGVAVGDGEIAVGSRGQIWTLRDRSELAPRIDPPGRYDRCFLPRSSVVTGGIQCHELAWGRDAQGNPDLWVVNTLFSCLAGLHDDFSFVPRWRPPFVSELIGQDRCHLNGLAMRDGRPANVTVMAQSDAPGGWRESRNDSGAILDVPSGQPVTRGLSMPHSPRWYDGSLFVLNSGMGRLERVDVASGKRDVVALLPGYARGLAFHGHYAFIGLSRIREKHIFGGAPIAEYHDQLKCGLGVIDMRTGDTVATLEFQSGVEEIFDVQVVPGTRCISLGGSPGSGEEIWLVPQPPA
jgi:uncharacterized protein (TIGR03032 family)